MLTQFFKGSNSRRNPMMTICNYIIYCESFKMIAIKRNLRLLTAQSLRWTRGAMPLAETAGFSAAPPCSSSPCSAWQPNQAVLLRSLEVKGCVQVAVAVPRARWVPARGFSQPLCWVLEPQPLGFLSIPQPPCSNLAQVCLHCITPASCTHHPKHTPGTLGSRDNPLPVGMHRKLWFSKALTQTFRQALGSLPEGYRILCFSRQWSVCVFTNWRGL